MSARKIGLFSTTAIVAGSMMGSGIALLPATLGAIGSITIFSWLIAVLGALGLAYLFSMLSLENPQEGGIVAYAGEVSPMLGHQAGVLYFHAGWIGNIASVLAATSYLSSVFPVLSHPVPASIVSISMIWVFTLFNLLGATWIGRLVAFGVALLFIPIFLTGFWGWAHFDAHLFQQNWNVSGHSNAYAVVQGVILCLWSFIGIESATVDANLVQNPKRIIPIATITGTLITSLIYVLSSTVINGMYPAKTIMSAGAPFALAVNLITGHDFTNIVVLIFTFACVTSFSAWIMLVGQAGARAAHDGNLPEIFGRLNRDNIPTYSILITGLWMSLLVAFLTLMNLQTSTMFTDVISVAVLLIVLPYYYSALNLLRLAKERPRAYLQIICSVVVGCFCIVAILGAGKRAIAVTLVLSLATFWFYVRKKKPT